MKVPRDTRVVITTHERADLKLQTTLQTLVEAKVRPLELVVQESQEEAYCRMLHKMKADWVSVTVLPREITRLYTTRQWILDDSFNSGQLRCLLFDDDLQFGTRRDDQGHYRSPTPRDIRDMVSTMVETLVFFGHVGIASRQGVAFAKDKVKAQHGLLTVGRMSRALGYRTDILVEHGVRYDTVDFVDDFQVTLSLLRHGVPNAIWYEWCQGERGGFNAPGGCSTQRTQERLLRAQQKLKRLFPQFVDLVQKSYKTTEDRQECRIQWHRAFAGQWFMSGALVKMADDIRQRAKSLELKNLRRSLAHA